MRRRDLAGQCEHLVTMPLARVLEGRRREHHLLPGHPVDWRLKQHAGVAWLYPPCKPRPRAMVELTVQLELAGDRNALGVCRQGIERRARRWARPVQRDRQACAEPARRAASKERASDDEARRSNGHAVRNIFADDERGAWRDCDHSKVLSKSVGIAPQNHMRIGGKRKIHPGRGTHIVGPQRRVVERDQVWTLMWAVVAARWRNGCGRIVDSDHGGARPDDATSS